MPALGSCLQLPRKYLAKLSICARLCNRRNRCQPERVGRSRRGNPKRNRIQLRWLGRRSGEQIDSLGEALEVALAAFRETDVGASDQIFHGPG